MKKKTIRIIKYFRDREKIPDNAVYLHSICSDFYAIKERQYAKEVRHYFIIYK